MILEIVDISIDQAKKKDFEQAVAAGVALTCRAIFLATSCG